MATALIEGRYRRGALLGGRYQVRAILGSGGMAEVYLAWDQSLRRRVAVKVLWEGLCRDPGSLARFHREAHAAASLSHPNVVAVFDLGAENGDPFMVMELVEGRGLDDLIWEEAPLSTNRALWIVEAVAGALSHAHDAGIFHRDVKPGNVMVTHDGTTVKVLDFGLARAVSLTPLTASQAIQGTPHYVAPELVRGQEADGRADLYSLGAVAYEMLVGRPPFTGDSSLGIAYRHVEEEPVPLRQWNREVPEAVERIVMRCLAKDPERRYQQAQDLRRDLRDLLGAPGLPSQGTGRWPGPATIPLVGPAGRPSPGANTPPFGTDPETPAGPGRGRGGSGSVSPAPRRWPAAAALALLLVALATLGASVWMQDISPPPSPPTPTPTVAMEALLAPTGLRAKGECGGFLSAEVTVTWAPTRGQVVEGYEVFRSHASDGPYRSVAFVLGRTSSRYVETEVRTGTDYWYLVKASGGGRTSAYSAPARTGTPSVCLFP